MKRPSETHPATREERGHSERLYFTFSFPSNELRLASSSISFLSSSSSSSSSCPSLLHFLLPRSRFFRGDRIRELTDAGITIPFVRPAGSDAADFSLEFLSRFGSGGIKHTSRPRDKAGDSRRLVNTGTGWSFIRFYDNANICDKISLYFPFTSILFFGALLLFDSLDIHYTFV